MQASMDSFDRARFAGALSAISTTLKRAVDGDDDGSSIPVEFEPLIEDGARICGSLSEGAIAKLRSALRKRAGEEEIDDGDLLRQLHDESRSALARASIPLLGKGESSQRLLATLIRVAREQPRLSLIDAYSVAWAQLSEEDQTGVIADELGSLRARIEEERAEEVRRQARSQEALGSIGKGMEMDIIKSARLVAEGQDVGLTKRAFHEALQKRAAEYRKDHPALTPEQAYAAVGTTTDDGRALIRAYAVAPRDPPAAAPPLDVNKTARAAEEGRRIMSDPAYAREVLATERAARRVA